MTAPTTATGSALLGARAALGIGGTALVATALGALSVPGESERGD